MPLTEPSNLDKLASKIGEHSLIIITYKYMYSYSPLPVAYIVLVNVWMYSKIEKQTNLKFWEK